MVLDITGEINFQDGLGSMQGVPLLYVPLEVVMSKYYGESERLLASIFSAGNELPEGAIVFLDEVSALPILTTLSFACPIRCFFLHFQTCND